MTDEELAAKEKTLFSTRDIVKVYPNNVGLQKALSQFINQIKLRPSASRMVKHNLHLPQIKVSFYNTRKLKQAIEDYIKNSKYKVCGERKENLNKVLEIINNKITNEDVTQPVS